MTPILFYYDIISEIKTTAWGKTELKTSVKYCLFKPLTKTLSLKDKDHVWLILIFLKPKTHLLV